eukprot:409575_1
MQHALVILDEMINRMDAEEHGSLQCKCGKVKIGLQEGRLRTRLECLCCDCRERIVCCTDDNKDNNPGVQDIIDCKKGADNWYIANSLIISNETKTLIDFFKLRKDSFMINMKTTCCGQYICAIHPNYQENVVVTSPDGPNITLAKNYQIPPQFFRCFKKDFPPLKYELLPKNISHIDFEDKKSKEKHQNLLDHVSLAFNKSPVKTKETIKFEQLLNDAWRNDWENIKKRFSESNINFS